MRWNEFLPQKLVARLEQFFLWMVSYNHMRSHRPQTYALQDEVIHTYSTLRSDYARGDRFSLHELVLADILFQRTYTRLVGLMPFTYGTPFWRLPMAQYTDIVQCAQNWSRLRIYSAANKGGSFKPHEPRLDMHAYLEKHCTYFTMLFYNVHTHSDLHGF